MLITRYQIKELQKQHPDKPWIGHKLKYFQAVKIKEGPETIASIEVILINERHDDIPDSNLFYVDYCIEAEDEEILFLCKDVKVILASGETDKNEKMQFLVEYDKADFIIKTMQSNSRPDLKLVK